MSKVETFPGNLVRGKEGSVAFRASHKTTRTTHSQQKLSHAVLRIYTGLRLVWEGILINWRLVWSVVCESGLRVGFNDRPNLTILASKLLQNRPVNPVQSTQNCSKIAHKALQIAQNRSESVGMAQNWSRSSKTTSIPARDDILGRAN